LRKGEVTKEYIIEKAAPLFNRKGFSGASISDLMQATGLKKGGIYNHFSNKDQLAVEAFNYAVNQLNLRYAEAVRGKASATEQLLAVFSIYHDVIDSPPFEGGCPLLNTAVESDDTHILLRERAQLAMDDFLRFLGVLILKGVRRGEFRSDLDVKDMAMFIAASFEGGIMMSKLYGDSRYIQTTTAMMKLYIQQQQK
jgi:TetR/AcrR family transcriptional repressor of nem operon